MNDLFSATGEPSQRAHAGVRSYLIGLIASAALTIAAYMLATGHTLNPAFALAVLIFLALLQFGAQVLTFLHLGSETQPRWKLYALASMVGIVLVIVSGSLWVMSNLNTRTTIDQQMQYMSSQGGP
ncbi:MAG: cytochrome C oxidase subunit IV family protein [Candidatus Dormibacteraeota bacterium]|nr:cytochrome C oxidase subunit IV family protein [Candidatus Dormibacteraeota bacterium]MDQ6885271.1 cytochrome C oxidase subunit IV family protein [Candidatus Dormibacteraeota bacterium]